MKRALDWRLACALSVCCVFLVSSCADDKAPPRRAPIDKTDGGDGQMPSADGGAEDGTPDRPQRETAMHEIVITPGADGVAADAPGVIRGYVVFDGDPPARREIEMKIAGCEHDGPPQLKETLVVSEGKVQYACVYINKGVEEGAYEVPEEPVYLDQVGCMYSPHVICVQVGQTILVRNLDDLLHNVHGPTSNKMQPAGAAPLELVYKRAEVGVFHQCDLHPWMSAYVCVADHPFQRITGPDGSFVLPEVPPGKYELVLWTEKYKKDRGLPAFVVPAGGEVVVTFHLSADSGGGGRRRRRGR